MLPTTGDCDGAAADGFFESHLGVTMCRGNYFAFVYFTWLEGSFLVFLRLWLWKFPSVGWTDSLVLLYSAVQMSRIAAEVEMKLHTQPRDNSLHSSAAYLTYLS